MRTLLIASLPILLLVSPPRGRAAEAERIAGRLVGEVRDADGKPITGAKMHLNNCNGSYETRGGNWAFTDASGRYALNIFIPPGKTAEPSEVIVSAKGFVQLRERFLLDEVIVRPGAETKVNYVLARGEVLSGSVDLPPPRRGAGGPRQFAIGVRGPSYKDYFLTDDKGGFEVWVPKGSYGLELVAMGGYPVVRLEDVPTGSRGVRLALPGVAVDVLEKAFDALWEDMDRNYSYFELKKVDWKRLRTRYRRRALEASSALAFVNVLADMLGELRDAHVWIEAPWGRVGTSPSSWSGNFNSQVVLGDLETPTHCGDFAVVGLTKKDRFAAIVLTHQSAATEENVAPVVDFIRDHADAPGFLVDLRQANGGNELLAQEIAQRFCGKDVVYARSKYRSGPGHDDFGPVYDRVLKAVDKPYLKPVVCLTGPGAVSSGEGFVQMLKCLPHVTTVGLRTRGSSGNPRAFALPGLDIKVWYSRWVDLMPDGTSIEGAGIAPEVEVNEPGAAYADRDPTWARALEVLRGKVRRK